MFLIYLFLFRTRIFYIVEAAFSKLFQTVALRRQQVISIGSLMCP